MHRVSGPDAAFLYGETPSWHMHVSGLLIIDPSETSDFSFERLREVITRRLSLVPQCRWKLVEVPLGLDRPLFVDDPGFDPDLHVMRIGVPPPGDAKALSTLVGQLVGYKLDRSRPLWELWVLEGLEGGRVGLLTKMHHSIIDGVSGADLATVLLDVEPDPPPPPEPPPLSDERVPSGLELLGRSVGSLALMPMKLSRLVPQIVRQGTTMIRYAVGGDPPAQAFQAPRTTFNGHVGPQRRFAYTTLSLDDMKAVRRAYDVKLNDVVLAVCAGALRDYLDERDELPSTPLTAQVPVSTRTEDTRETIGTLVANMFTSLATDIDDPAERLLAIHTGTQRAKEMRSAMSAQKIMNLTDTTPPALIALAARAYTGAGLDGRTPPVFNLIISNVPGPPFDLYIAGAKVEASFPMGPLLFGSGLNITVMSKPGGMDFGVLTCRTNVPDPWQISDRLEPALAELLQTID